MKTCPYCGSGVQLDSGSYYCDFCVMSGITPVEDGARISGYRRRDSIDHDDIKKTTPELMIYHTFDLLRLLKLLREEKRAYFKHLTTFKRASNETDEFKEIEIQTGNDYEEIKRKTFIVENIIKERMGYIPQVVSNRLLLTVYERIEEERNLKPMIIKKSNPEQTLER